MNKMNEQMSPKVIYMEKPLLDLATKLSKSDRRFYSGGRPSSSKVIRIATRLFFALDAHSREQMLNDMSVTPLTASLIAKGLMPMNCKSKNETTQQNA
jgi:hypothetical protein